MYLNSRLVLLVILVVFPIHYSFSQGYHLTEEEKLEIDKKIKREKIDEWSKKTSYFKKTLALLKLELELLKNKKALGQKELAKRSTLKKDLISVKDHYEEAVFAFNWWAQFDPCRVRKVYRPGPFSFESEELYSDRLLFAVYDPKTGETIYVPSLSESSFSEAFLEETINDKEFIAFLEELVGDDSSSIKKENPESKKRKKLLLTIGSLSKNLASHKKVLEKVRKRSDRKKFSLFEKELGALIASLEKEIPNLQKKLESGNLKELSESSLFSELLEKSNYYYESLDIFLR